MKSIFTRISTHFSTHKPVWFTAIALVTALAAFQIVRSQAASTTNEVGSSLGVVGQVVQSASGNTNSTDAISSGDTVQWTNFFQSKLDSPYRSVGEMNLPTDFKWVKGSVVLPPNVTLEYWNGTKYVAAEPASGTVVAKVRWTIDPMVKLNVTPAVNGAIDFNGSGDGYRVITYKDQLWIVNHHQFNNYLHCRMASDGSFCPGFRQAGKTISGTAGVIADTDLMNEPFLTVENSREHLDPITGNLYLYVGGYPGTIGGSDFDWEGSRGDKSAYVLCVNLNTLKSCMNAVKVFSGDRAGKKALNPIGSIGSKYYAVTYEARLLCFDTATQQVCSNSGFTGQKHFKNNAGLDRGHFSSDPHAMTYVSNNLLFYVSDYRIRCFDTISRDSCQGWAVDSASTHQHDMYPILSGNANAPVEGVLTAMCTRHSDNVNLNERCRKVDGSYVAPSSNYIAFLKANLFFYGSAHAQVGVYKTRVFHTQSGIHNGANGIDNASFASCFDFATDALCTGAFPMNSITPAIPGRVSVGGMWAPVVYSIVRDTVRPNCMWAVGDQQLAKAFNPLTGADCPATTTIPPAVVLNVEPAINYNCDGSLAAVTGYDKIRFSPALSWTGADALTRMRAKIMRPDGTTIAVANNPRDFANGSYHLDISDIPYQTYPALKIELTIEAGNKPINVEVGFDVTWFGPPSQLCFKTVAPTLGSCQVDVKVNQTNTAIHIPNVVESLNAANGLTPGRTQAGVGPGVVSTTLRQYPKGTNDATQVLQTRYDLATVTGDLWKYPLNTDYSLALTPDSKASDNTNSRTVWTATSTTPGSLSKVGLAHNNLTAAEKALFGTNAQGISDNLGHKRTAYIAGSNADEGTGTGKFRVRANVLGTAIGSSAVVMPKNALVGYNDATFPHYNAYRKGLSRPDNIAFYTSNDGMLHAYKVRANGLEQAFSYFPNMLFSQAASKIDATLSQARLKPYWMDNTPMVREVNLGNTKDENKWSTVVVANQGRGGRGVFALEVKSGGLDKVIFEYDNTKHADLIDMGYQMSQPPSDTVAGASQIVRMADERWAYVMGNGIDSNVGSSSATNGTGKAVLYIMYFTPNSGGPRWRKYSVNTSATPDLDLDFKNGLGTPRPVDTDGNGSIDVIYAGDRKGNLWRFNVGNFNAVTVTKVFKAPEGQPILSAPVVSRSSGQGTCAATKANQCWMVSFGTGEPLNPLTTSNSTVKQAFYGVFDNGDVPMATITPSQLVTQTITTSSPVAGVTYRNISKNPVVISAGTGGIRGWKIILSDAEHTTATPQLRADGSVMFASTRPSGTSVTSCSPADSWLTVVSINNGFGLDKAFEQGPGVSINGPVYGSLGSATSTISMLPKLKDSVPNPSVSSNTCTPGTFGKDGTYCASKTSMLGRMSWREVFGLPK